jgi:hypothetical protein
VALSLSKGTMLRFDRLRAHDVEGHRCRRFNQLSGHDDVVETCQPAWTRTIALAGGSPGSAYPY